MFNGKHTPPSMQCCKLVKYKLFNDKNDIKATVQVCSYHAKDCVPLDHCYLAPLRYLFTNTLKFAHSVVHVCKVEGMSLTLKKKKVKFNGAYFKQVSFLGENPVLRSFIFSTEHGARS